MNHYDFLQGYMLLSGASRLVMRLYAMSNAVCILVQIRHWSTLSLQGGIMFLASEISIIEAVVLQKTFRWLTDRHSCFIGGSRNLLRWTILCDQTYLHTECATHCPSLPALLR